MHEVKSCGTTSRPGCFQAPDVPVALNSKTGPPNGHQLCAVERSCFLHRSHFAPATHQGLLGCTATAAVYAAALAFLPPSATVAAPTTIDSFIAAILHAMVCLRVHNANRLEV